MNETPNDNNNHDHENKTPENLKSQESDSPHYGLILSVKLPPKKLGSSNRLNLLFEKLRGSPLLNKLEHSDRYLFKTIHVETTPLNPTGILLTPLGNCTLNLGKHISKPNLSYEDITNSQKAVEIATKELLILMRIVDPGIDIQNTFRVKMKGVYPSILGRTEQTSVVNESETELDPEHLAVNAVYEVSLSPRGQRAIEKLADSGKDGLILIEKNKIRAEFEGMRFSKEEVQNLREESIDKLNEEIIQLEQIDKKKPHQQRRLQQLHQKKERLEESLREKRAEQIFKF